MSACYKFFQTEQILNVFSFYLSAAFTKTLFSFFQNTKNNLLEKKLLFMKKVNGQWVDLRVKKCKKIEGD